MLYLETERLILRGWVDGDLAPFAAMNGDARVMEFYPAPLPRAESDAFAGRIRDALQADGFGLYALEVKATGAFIGYTGFARAEFPAAFTPAIEIGWRLAFPAWGQGYATEAACACLAHGFAALGFAEIVSITARPNHRSISVMERIGMTRDRNGDFDHPALPNGHPLRPHVLYRVAATRG